MPIYEYRCEKCGKVFEKMQKFSDAPVTVHEDCGGAVERLISTSALMFKGSGFYITDYAKSGTSPKGEAKSDGASESKGSESKPETSSDSKPASETKSESKPAATTTKSD
jgi:putative FmdB family regulatory protein